MEICSHFDSLLQLVRKFSAYGFSQNFLFLSSPPHLFSSHIRKHDFLSAGSTTLAQEQKVRLCSLSFRFHSHHGGFRGHTGLISESVQGEQDTTKVALLFHRHSGSELLNYLSLKS